MEIKNAAKAFFEQINLPELVANNYDNLLKFFTLYYSKNMKIEIFNKKQKELLPFELEANVTYGNYFRMSSLLTLAAKKAFALGRRGKWKDYVHLYFIIKYELLIKEIFNKTKLLFTDFFNPLLFLKQLSFYKDISYKKQVKYIPGFEIEDDVIKKFLTKEALKNY